MWSTVVVRHLFLGEPNYDFLIKPVFDYLLFINFKVAEALAVHPMDLARGLFAINSVVAVFFFFRLVECLSPSTPLLPGLLSGLWITNSFFIKRFSNVRSDALVTSLTLGFLLLTTSRWWQERRPWTRLVLFMIYALYAFAITPKAGVIALAVALIFLRDELRATVFPTRWRACLGTLACIAIALSLREMSYVKFFLRSMVDSGGLEYWTVERLEHLIRFCYENPLILFIWVFNFYFGFKQTGRALAGKFFALANSLTLWLAVYPDRLPFFIASLIPFWLLPIASGGSALRAFHKVSWRRLRWLIGAFSILSMGFWTTFLVFHHDASEQRAAIHWLESRPEFADLKIFDPVGILPYLPVDHFFVGPSEPGNEDTFRMLKSKRLDVILATNRLIFMPDAFFPYLDEHYHDEGSGVFVRRFYIPSDNGELLADEIDGYLIDRLALYHLKPERKLYFAIESLTGEDLSRAAYWLTKTGEKRPFQSKISPTELEEMDRLILPDGIRRLIVQPIHLPPPPINSLRDLFSFDTTI